LDIKTFGKTGRLLEQIMWGIQNQTSLPVVRRIYIRGDISSTTPVHQKIVANLNEFMERSRDLATDTKLIFREHLASSTHHNMKIHEPRLYVLDFMNGEVGTNILMEYNATIFTPVQAWAVCSSDMLVPTS